MTQTLYCKIIYAGRIKKSSFPASFNEKTQIKFLFFLFNFTFSRKVIYKFRSDVTSITITVLAFKSFCSFALCSVQNTKEVLKRHFTVSSSNMKLKSKHKILGGGRNVEFHYYNWPFFSLHRKWLFS